MFDPNAQGIMQPATYGALRDAETILLDDEDHDVFGDGSVVVMSAPGHTTGRTPTFEHDAEQSLASRARIDAFLDETDGTLWIEHDIATHARLPRAPDYID